MLTTLEVRAIMHKHGRSDIWTNKTRDNCGNERTVKCYEPRNPLTAKELSKELIKKAGYDNVHFTAGNAGLSGITVKCIIAGEQT